MPSSAVTIARMLARVCSTGGSGRPAPVPVGYGHVLVRLVDVQPDDAALARDEALLTPAERARARRGTAAVRRRRVTLRAALRRALAEELDVPPGSVPLDTTPDGRPGLAPAAGAPDLDANCSASGRLGVVAVGRRCRVGVDVERVAPWSPAVLEEGWLNAEEARALIALPPAARAVAATRAWTQKEAVLKARGTGLRADPAAVRTAVGQRTGVVAGWELRDLPVPDGWVATLAVGPAGEARS